VPGFFADHPDIKVVMAPRPIPGGSVAGFHDPAGNLAYVFDQVER
jgi:predicted enzyme related to lactoylglutathione lyase